MEVAINPTILELPIKIMGNNLEIRWYGVMYLISFIIAFIYLSKVYKRDELVNKFKAPVDMFYDVIIVAALGVIIGGRLGYIFLYKFSYYMQNPVEIFQIWRGGMSFHGALIGVCLGLYIYTKVMKLDFYKFADPSVVIVPVGLFFGRIGNFINGELFGRETTVPWAMKFMNSDPFQKLRHPSQLYEALLEGLALFLILFFLEKRQRQKGDIKKGFVFWVFIFGYGLFRFISEFFRQPDGNLGFVFGPFTMGQVLSFIMIVVAIIMGYIIQSGTVTFPDVIPQKKEKKSKK